MKVLVLDEVYLTPALDEMVVGEQNKEMRR